MDNRSAVRDFLISRRGRLTPEQASIAAGAGADLDTARPFTDLARDGAEPR